MPQSRRAGSWPRAMCLLLAALHLIFHSCVSLGEGPREGFDSSIPTDVQVLMAGCEDNQQRIGPLELTMKLRVHTPNNPAVDLDGKEYCDRNGMIVLWKDGERIREDSEFDRRFRSDGTIAYNLPFGEHIAPRDEVDLVSLKRQHGVMETTRRLLWNGKELYEYVDEGKTCIITDKFDPKWCDDFSVPTRWLATNRLSWYSAPEFVRRVGEAGDGAFSVRGLGDDRYAVEIAGRTWRHEFTVDTNQGYTISNEKHMIMDDAGWHVEEEGDYRYAEYGSAWVLVAGERKRYDKKTWEPLEFVTMTVEQESLMVNEPIDPSVFSMDALKMRKGTYVVDTIVGRKYVYNDIPIDLKVALVAAKRDQYVLPEELLSEQLPGAVDGRGTSGVTDPQTSGQPRPTEKDESVGDTVNRSVTDHPWVALSAVVALVAGAFLLARGHRRKTGGG